MAEQQIISFVGGRLESAELADFERHVEDCEACRALVVDLANATADAPSRESIKIGRYEILEPIGAGNMGIVYAARDPQLGRSVAVKLLRPGTARPSPGAIVREAEAMARMSHPGVVAVYDAGVHDGQFFVVMELIEGGTLRQWLAERPRSWREVLETLLSAGRGLAAAHAAGLVHRDFKPDNVLVSSDGRVRVTDFGLAQLAGPAPPGPVLDPTLLVRSTTATGTIAGSPAYMAPELSRGLPADARSDLFSFCASAYESLCGVLPFAGRTLEELARNAEHGAVQGPARPGAPKRIRALLKRGLAFAREDRPQSVESVLDALEAAARRSRVVRLAALLAAGATIVAALAFMRSRPPHDPAVAVLPFVNLSGDKENDYFSDGMTEELINALANVKGLRVASRTSAFAFKGKNLGIQTIGKELNVGAVLEGSIRREGGGLRIAAQLINAADGYHIWSATYDRELKNIFAVEEELARSIVFALKPRLVPSEAASVVRRTTADPAAHDLYLQGRYLTYKRNAESLRKAKVYFQQAIDKDPGYALAYLGLADATGLLLQYGPSPPREAIPQARDLMLKALELDDGLAEAHVSFAAHNQASWNWSAAEREYRRAIELKPEYPIAHNWYSSLLMFTGRPKEARAEAERARQLDPTSLNLNTSLALTFYGTREYDQAVEQARKTLELEPGYAGGLYCLALVSLARGRYSDAVGILARLEGSADYPPVLGYAYAISGQRAEALRMLAEFEARSRREYVASSARAIIYMGLGDKDQAFAWLDRAYADQDYRLRELKAFPLWDSLRSDPRFTRLLRQMHLEQ